MNILFVYPETPLSFWSFKDALKFVSKKAPEPPLGLITVAAMLPEEWEMKLIDMNVSKLKDKHILWADYVFLSGMNIHINSFKDVIRRCNTLGIKIVVGGPLATTQPDDFLGVDHFILNEAENTLPPFLEDLKNGNPKYMYTSDEFPDVTTSPTPRWGLLEIKRYAGMAMQYSRGCPYDCEFCSIIQWSKQKKYPFNFGTEVSVNLSDDKQLMDMMVEAGFNSLFVGIETPNDESLKECGKAPNRKRNLITSVWEMQKHGFIVAGGFIVGFDNDTKQVFDEQIDFIQESGIVTAMVGLLNAPTGTKLFKRLQSENRLLKGFATTNTDGSINFIPRMNYGELIAGYSNIIKTIYSQKEYYTRLKHFLYHYNLPGWSTNKIRVTDIKAFLKLIWLLGIIEKGKRYFWKLLGVSLFKFPKKFTLAMTFAVYGYHFRRIASTI